MRSHKTIRRGLSVALAIVLLFATFSPVLATEFSDDADYISDGFGADYEKTVKRLAKAYGWNTEHINAQQWNYTPLSLDMLSSVLPSVSAQGHSYSPAVSMATRQYSFQDQYFLDNINTTRAYMGLPPFGYEYANGGSIVAVALAEAEATSRNTEVPIHSNNVCYNTAYYGRPVSGDSYPWCAAFVWWCANQLGIAGVGSGDISSCITADDEEATFKKTASSTAQYCYLTEQKSFAATTVSDTKPMGGLIDVYPGDIIFFKSNEANKYKHIGIVVGVTEDTITTVEGNYNDHVAKVTYTKNSTNYSFRNGKIVHVEYPASVAVKLSDVAMAKNLLTDVQSITSVGVPALCAITGQLYVDKGTKSDVQNVLLLGSRDNNDDILRNIVSKSYNRMIRCEESSEGVSKATDEWIIMCKAQTFVEVLLGSAALYSSNADIPEGSAVEKFMKAHGVDDIANYQPRPLFEQGNGVLSPLQCVQYLLEEVSEKEGLTIADLIDVVFTEEKLSLYRGTAISVYMTFFSSDSENGEDGNIEDTGVIDDGVIDDGSATID